MESGSVQSGGTGAVQSGGTGAVQQRRHGRRAAACRAKARAPCSSVQSRSTRAMGQPQYWVTGRGAACRAEEIGLITVRPPHSSSS